MTIDFVPDPGLYPFRSRWHERPAGRVHYVDEGEGRPILFLHGNPTWSFLWRGPIARLRDRFRCVAPDYPGFGLSDRPEHYGYTPAEHAVVVRELVEALELDDLVVVGHDWGGPIGLSVASDLADRVAGLAFVDTWIGRVDRLVPRLFGLAMASWPGRWAILQRNALVERGIPMGTVRELDEREMAHYRAAQPDPAARVGVAELPRQLRKAGPWLEALKRRAPRVLGGVPCLLAWGERDRAFPASAWRPRFEAAFPHAGIVRLEGAGHFSPEDAPGPIAGAIARRFGRPEAVADPGDA